VFVYIYVCVCVCLCVCVWNRMKVFRGFYSVNLTTFDIDGYSRTGRKCVWRKKREFENTTFSANVPITNLMIRCVT